MKDIEDIRNDKIDELNILLDKASHHHSRKILWWTLFGCFLIFWGLGLAFLPAAIIQTVREKKTNQQIEIKKQEIIKINKAIDAMHKEQQEINA